MPTLEELTRSVREFVRERDWEQFHDPKNLATGLSIEASELLELFLWTRTEEAHEQGRKERERVAEELGDVMLYCIMLGDTLGIDPIEAAAAKLGRNRRKYPVHLAKGSAEKYWRLHESGSEPESASGTEGEAERG